MNTNKIENMDEFFVELVAKSSTSVFKFSLSKTGVLDFSGEVDGVDFAGYQQMECSTYFSPSWYTFLPKNLQAEIRLRFKDGMAKLNASQYSFLMHVGALLLAVKERDSLLVAELLHRRPMVFSPFLPMVLYIVKPIAAEALFAWTYGRFGFSSELQRFYDNDSMVSDGEMDTGIILYSAAREGLKPNPLKESINEMFIRYFQEHPNVDFTMGIVGAPCHFWTNGFHRLDSAINHHVAKDFVEGFEALRNARQKFFEGLSVSMQAEPYNPHDANAISVSIEDIEAKISGSGGKTKAGYIRATGAAILRKARPELFAYESSLWRVGNSQDSKLGVVLRVRF